MTIETIQIQSQDQWLAERVKDVTSTEVSALFDLNPYLTQFELYQQKSTGQVVKIPENTRMKWGKRLEAPIALGVAEDEGWDIAKDTWSGGVRNGGGIWETPSIDPDLGVLYLQVANPSPDLDGSGSVSAAGFRS